MKQIFGFSDVETIYQRCILASVSHAIMVGKFNMLASEQSWDGENYNFQNMEGTRGVISFNQNNLVCVIQNERIINKGVSSGILDGADENILLLAENEAFLYMTIEDGGSVKTLISSAFWSQDNKLYANVDEGQLIEDSDNILLPYLYSAEDAMQYWTDYYEMNEQQRALVEQIFLERIAGKENVFLSREIRKMLINWFGDISDCIESLEEMNIYIED